MSVFFSPHCMNRSTISVACCTDSMVWSVCVLVNCEPYKNASANWDSIWRTDLHGFKEPHIRWGCTTAHWHHLANVMYWLVWQQWCRLSLVHFVGNCEKFNILIAGYSLCTVGTPYLRACIQIFAQTLTDELHVMLSSDSLYCLWSTASLLLMSSTVIDQAFMSLLPYLA